MIIVEMFNFLLKSIANVPISNILFCFLTYAPPYTVKNTPFKNVIILFMKSMEYERFNKCRKLDLNVSS